jgi:predicted nucleic acid-binding protein
VIDLILDKSALLAYAAHEARTVAVAELMLMVEENNGVLGIASIALLEAYREAPSADERARMVRLVTRAEHAVAILPLLGSDAVPVLKMWPELSNGDAHTVVDAVRFGASIASCDPEVFDGVIDESVIYEV